MFQIATNTGGEAGPFLNYKNRAGQGMGDGTWYLRSKEGDNWKYTDMTEVMKGGIVADIFATPAGELGGSLKIGYIKFSENEAPTRSWWNSPLAAEQRPTEEKSAGGGFIWQNAVAFRTAIGGGEDALFDVSGWSGYKGVMALVDQMNGGFAANVGKCPLFQYTGFRVEGTGQKRLHVPEFVIAQWVDRPACLTPDAPQIGAASAATAPDPTPTPTPAPAPQPSASVPAGASF